MSVQLSIPDSVIVAIRLPEKRIEQELLVELALALYSQELLSFGKARELASMGKYEFGKLLGERGINRHYELAELRVEEMLPGSDHLREALVAGWLQVREVNNPFLVQKMGLQMNLSMLVFPKIK